MGVRCDWVSEDLLDANTTLVAQLEVPLGETRALIRRVRRRGGRCVLNLAPALPIDLALLPEKEMESRTPSIIDLNAELAKLTLFRERTPESTMADRKGSAVRLASYRDGALTATKFAGRVIGNAISPATS
jgi:hypothetical protein